MANTHTKDDIRDRAQDAKGQAENMMEQGKNMAQQAMDKGRDMAQTAADRAKEMGTAGVSSVAGGLRNAAETIKGYAPQGGMVGSAASSLTDSMENAGRYLEEKGMSGAAEDLTLLIRRHPVPSVLIGIGVGILLGQFMTSSRR